MSLEPLRIGLLLDSDHLPAWLYTAIEGVMASSSTEMCAVVLIMDPDRKPEAGRLIPRLYSAIDEKIFVRHNNACVSRNIGPLLRSVPPMQIQSTYAGKEGSLSPEVADTIRGYKLDILVNACRGKIPAGLAGAAHY